MDSARLHLILAFSFGLMVGCSLSDPKPRQKPSPVATESSPEKPVKPEVSRPAASSPANEIEGLPRSVGPGTNPGTTLPAVGAPTITTTDDPKSEANTPKKPPMKVPWDGMLTEFMSLTNLNYRYVQGSPALPGSPSVCQVELIWDKKKAGAYNFLTVKIDGKTWNDFLLAIPESNGRLFEFTKSDNGKNDFHNLTLANDTATNERLSIQYLVASDQRKISHLTFERRTNNANESLVCQVTQP